MHTTAQQLDSLELNEESAASQGQKRSSSNSMIFRIEQLLPGGTTSTTMSNYTNTTNSTQTKRRQTTNSLRPGVYAAQYTPKDTCSSLVPTTALLGCMDTPTPTDAHVHCNMVNGELLLSATLLRQIKLSEDIYSFNALFELHGGQLRIRLVRDVGREDEIVAWFGEELVLLMGIPFLTPLNIQGNNRYTCHLCHLTFETPHPLKIHLALGCGRSVMDLLWMRLHYALKSAARAANISPTPATSSTSSASPNRSSPPTLQSAAIVQATPSARFSAFRPLAAMQSMTLPNSSHSSSYLPSMAMGAPLSTHPMNAAAQIEAIVSNMGASKQGHLCIYCGKVYSRKYGLKIHIRTHTGFKPLKCKFCLRPFGDPSNLNKHVRLHMQTQPGVVTAEAESDSGFQCQICHKSLARSRDLQRHMETRHGGVSSSTTSSTPTPPPPAAAKTTTATTTTSTTAAEGTATPMGAHS